MRNAFPKNTLMCLDMVTLRSGEILSLCGNFNGPWYRARLTFYPHPKSTRIIQRKPYQKVSFETGYMILGCTKLLDLPGEQHFLVHQSQIDRVHRASRAFEGLSGDNLEQCQILIKTLDEICGLGEDQHGLTGSGALHNILPTSDFDWIIYSHNPTPVEAYVISSEKFERELTFPMTYAYTKYAVFNGLARTDIDALFKDRWKYFRFRDLRISVSFVDPSMRVDNFLNTPVLGDRVLLEGVVTDGVGCYHMPRIIPLNGVGKNYQVLTWLFLYNGAFRTGDVVQVAGKTCVINRKEYILVESAEDYIRKVGGR